MTKGELRITNYECRIMNEISYIFMLCVVLMTRAL